MFILNKNKTISLSDNFTKNFLIRFISSIVISILFVSMFSIMYKQKINHDYKLQEFKPASQIKRLTDISIESSNYYFNPLKKNNSSFLVRDLNLTSYKKILNKQIQLGCSRRQKALIFENIYTNNLSLNNKYDFEEFLIDTIDKHFSSTSSNCNQFINDFKILENLNLLGLDNDTNKSKKIIENFLTEKTSWILKSPCLYIKDKEGDLTYLSGSIPDCYFGKQIKRSLPFGLDANIGEMANIVYQQLYNTSDGLFTNHLSNRNYTITLDPQIQGWLNLYKKCFVNLEFCESISVKSLSKMNNLSIVILNSTNSEILGAICLGRRCNSGGLNVYKDLASLHVKSPPASISKLLFALSFSSDNSIEKEMLLRQIKTSGQIDPKLGMRNEWWEKKAICDGKQIVGCEHYKNVAEFSRLFGIATNCIEHRKYRDSTGKTSSLNCGDTSLVTLSDGNRETRINYGLNGFIGTNELLDQVVTGEKGLAKFIRWKNYERIRRNKNLLSQQIEFSNTSRVLQSLLGAGDNRISALGIAALVSQISQITNKKQPILPILVKGKKTMISENQVNKNLNNSKFIIKSAENVLSGMQKSILKEEYNWSGNGTAYSSFIDIFGKECNKDCPIKGKTGTVSINDKNYSGTTLFTGLIDSKKIQRYVSKTIPKNLPNLAMGVIVFTEQDSSDGHYASQLFMSVLKDIISKESVTEIISEKNSIIDRKYSLKYESK